MTIHTLTDKQLSWWIAEKLEPAPEYASKQTFAGMSREPVSKGGFWTWANGWGNEPLDMVNDPAMTVMLLEKLVVLDRQYGCPHFTHPLMSALNFDHRIKLGRAVAEAFANAHGFEESA